MSFLSPLFLFGAAAAAVPLVLHLLKREPEPRVKFAAVRLLKQAPVEHADRRHLRQLWLLALRVATLVLLALAFARPFFGSSLAFGSSGATVVALDTSYSMSAPGRFERARRLAKEAISRVPAGEAVGVITFADEAELVVKPSADRVMAESAIDKATATFGATRYRAALATAARALAGRRGVVIVITDLQAGGWDAGARAAFPESSRIEVVDVGELPPNLAVTTVREAGDRVMAGVRNSATTPREARLSLFIDDRAAGTASVSIGASQSADVTFSPVPRGLIARVEVGDGGGLQADNVRYAIGGPPRPPVLVVTATGDAAREAFYVQQALVAGAPGGSAYDVVTTGGAELSSWSDDRVRSNAAIILLSTRGLDRRARELLSAYVRGGGGMLIAAGQDIDGDVVAGVLGGNATLHMTTVKAKVEERTLAPEDVRHPVFLPFGDNAASLGLVRFRSVSEVGGAGCETVARFTTGESALLDCTAGDGHTLVLASDLDNRGNDFPLHTTFVPFVHEAVRYLASHRAQTVEYLVGEVPAGVAPTPGIAMLPTDETARSPRRIAVNVDPREGDPARISADEFQAAVTRLKDEGVSESRLEARQHEERQHLWRYLLVVMISALVLEGMVARRTV
jgi:hypothetical protein